MSKLPTYYQEFIATSRYARWLDDKNRRETWTETVDRFIERTVKPKLKDDLVVEMIREYILDHVIS